jgi:hypothetical protein
MSLNHILVHITIDLMGVRALPVCVNGVLSAMEMKEVVHRCRANISLSNYREPKINLIVFYNCVQSYYFSRLGLRRFSNLALFAPVHGSTFDQTG